MPFTPFHLGPGALFKAIGGPRFSFMVFGGSQVLIDLEPLIRMIRDDAILHGPTHTIPGAFAIALIAGLLGKPISLFVLRRLDIPHRTFGWTISFVSAFLGTFSHLALDAIMHSDMMPMWPLTPQNPALSLISTGHLHLLCLAAALVAGVIVGLRSLAANRPE